MGGGPAPVDLLILGRGWTAEYLIALIRSTTKPSEISYAATTRDGRDGTIPFAFEPDGEGDGDEAAFERLPDARVVLVTFPLKGAAQPGRLVGGYERSRRGRGSFSTGTSTVTAASTSGSGSGSGSAGVDARSTSPGTRDVTTTTTTTSTSKWILLGATSTWSIQEPTTPDSPWDHDNTRAQAEQALLELKGADAVVPCLAGLYGGRRQPREFARGGRLAATKEKVKERTAVHFVHGEDVARGLLRLVGLGLSSAAAPSPSLGGGEATGDEGWRALAGKRWIVTDLRCYDWWDLLSSWDGAVNGEADGGSAEGEKKIEYAKWVGELMEEEGVAVLPREPSRLGRVLDGRDWWQKLGVWPTAGRLS